MVKRVGEALEDTGIWSVTWPVRLWIVEPVGDTANRGQRYYPLPAVRPPDPRR
ncbi:hypothetical protein ACWGMA_29465 [Streptomyces asiaticus]